MRKIVCLFLAVLLCIGAAPSQLLGQQATSMIAGTVLDGQCNPVPDVRIIASNPSRRVLAEASTNAQGHYDLRNLAPGQVQLTLDPLKNSFQGGTVVASLGQEELTVNWLVSTKAKAVALATALIDPGGRFGFGMGTIDGTVFASERVPVPDVQIFLNDPSGKVRSQAVTNTKGQYNFLNLTPGPYQLKLDPAKSGFLGDTVLVCACPGDLTIDWTVSTAADAIATEGTGINICGGLFGLGLFGLSGLAVGIAVRLLRVTSPSR
ncbi:MAG: carboxypeptidase-like regulatory domain-containing protein [Candidatus Binatia bacterium]